MLLLKTMLGRAKPLSAEDLLKAAAKHKFKTHKTSVYRQLSLLKEEAIIREIQLGERKKRYEIYPDNHHHHFVCVDCGRIEDVSAEKDLAGLEKKISQEKKFKIASHSLEFFGLCADCKP